MEDPEREAKIDDFEAQGLANVDRLEAAVKAAGVKLTFDNSDELRTDRRQFPVFVRMVHRYYSSPLRRA
jgi:hypothetical protein